MTFLMHAARGCPESTTKQLQKEQAKKEEKKNPWKKNQPKQKQPEAGNFKILGTYTSSPARRASAPSGQMSISESEREVELDELRSRKPSVASAGAFTAPAVSAEASQNNPGGNDGPQQGNTPASRSPGKGHVEDTIKDSTSENHSFAQENGLGVFKIAWSLVKDTLWKEHVCIGFEKKEKHVRKVMTIKPVQEDD